MKFHLTKIVFVFTLFIFQIDFYAQEKAISGIVSDSLQNPISWANVIAIPQDKAEVMKFAITDDRGRYKLLLSKKTGYEISVTFLGYEKFSFQLLPYNPIQNLNIKLKPSNNLLGEVVIMEQPVRKNHDTLSYNVEAFKTGDERKLKDIVEKLPGIEMDKNGQITVQGKKVTKLTVDGRDFFGGGTKMAVDNIPADAVKGIDFVDKYQLVGFLKDFDESEELAMNIKLKKDKKKFAFGSVEAGSDLGDKYLGHANLFYYSPKTNVNFIGDANNAGQQFFTYSNAMDFNGGVGSLMREGIFGNSVYDSDLYDLIEFKDYTSRKNLFGALNLNSQLGNNLKFSVYAIGSGTKSGSEKLSQKEYFLGESGYKELYNTMGNTDNKFGNSKVVFDYTPSDMQSFYFMTKVKYSNDNSKKNDISDIDGVSSEFEQNSDNATMAITQNIEWHKRISKDRALSAGISYNYNNKSPRQQWISESPLLEGLVPLVTDSIYWVNQQKDGISNRINLIAKHYWNITNLSQINISVGNYYVNDTYTTSENQLLTDGSTVDFGQSGFGSQMRLVFNDLFISTHYKFKKGISIVNAGVYTHYFLWEIQQGLKTTKQRIAFLPDFSLKFKLTSAMDLNLAYQIKSQFPQTQNLTENYSLQNYYSVMKGNPTLENELYHKASVYYSLFSMFRKLMVHVRFDFNKKFSGILYQTKIEEQKHYTYPVLMNNPETSYTLSSSVSKGVRKFSFVLNLNVRLSDYLQEINGIMASYRSINQMYMPEIRTNYKKWPNFSVGYQIGQSQLISAEAKNSMITGKPTISLKYDFLSGMIINANYFIEHNKDQTTGQTNRFDMANVSVYYQQKKSPWGFEISATNLFDNKARISYTNSDYLSVIDKNYIMPRIYLFTISYHL